ncbi:retrovirus-related pol polyprotein from transposon TNT 1-94 [Tanacetum coccineum]
MNQTQRANNSIKNDSLATLFGKYNYEEGLIDQIYELETSRFSIQAFSSKALISNTYLQDSDSDVVEDTRSRSEFLADLNAKFHDRELLSNLERFYKRSERVGSAKKPIDKSNETCFACGKYKGLKAEISILSKKIDGMSKGKTKKGLVAESFNWDNESVSSEDEGTTIVKAFMAIVEDEPSIGKVAARSGQWVEIIMKKVQRLLSMTDGDERKHVLDYTHVDLHYVEDQRKNLLSKFNFLNQELSLCKSEFCDLKNTKALNSSLQNEIARLNLENESLKDDISDLEKVIDKWTSNKSPSETAPEITFDSESECDNQEPLPLLPELSGAEPIGTLEDVITLADLTQTSSVSKKTKKVPDKESLVKAIKKKDQTKSPSVPDPSTIKKTDSSTKKLLLTLMEEESSLRKAPKAPKPFIQCKYCVFNDHHADECEYYPGCDICGSIAHETANCVKKSSSNNRKPRIANQRSTEPIEKYSKESGPKVVFGDNSSGDTEGYGLVNCNGITFIGVVYVNGLKHNLISISQLCDANFKVLFTKTQGTIFNQNNKVVLIDLRRRDDYVIDMSSYNKESNACFFSKASNSVNWLCHKRLSHLNFKHINKLARQKLVAGLSSLTLSKDKTCAACEKRKHHRASFKTKRSFSINKCLHLLHMDLFGLVKPQTISHNKYTLVIVAEYSSFRKAGKHLLVYSSSKKIYFCIVKNMEGGQHMMYLRRKSHLYNYFHAVGCLVHIHNHRDHLGKFDEKADDGFFLGYSPVAKAFRVFNIRRQETEETYHVTFSEDDEAITKSSIEGDEINFNENRIFPDDEFLVPRSKVSQSSGKVDYFPYVPAYDPLSTNNITIPDPFSIADDHPVHQEPNVSNPANNSKLAKTHIDVSETQNITISGVEPSPSEPQAGRATRRRIRDSEAASAHECLYVNLLSDSEPKKLIEALEEEGWIIAMQDELKQFE